MTPPGHQRYNTPPTIRNNQNHARSPSMTALQHVPPTEPPPAPDPQACPIPAYQPPPPTKMSLHTVCGQVPLADNPAPKTEPNAFPSTHLNSKTTIPNWARPAVLPPTSSRPMAGLFCAGKPWPPPCPERKTIPFKKQPQTKPTATNRKDFLWPP